MESNALAQRIFIPSDTPTPEDGYLMVQWIIALYSVTGNYN